MKILLALLFSISAAFAQGPYNHAKDRTFKFSIFRVTYDWIWGRRLSPGGHCTAFQYRGYTITNHHCVDKRKGIRPVFVSDKGKQLRLLAINRRMDIAILSGTKRPGFKSAKYRLGQPIYSMGFPRFAQYFMSKGILSTTTRENYVIHDAVIMPGSSGGPVVNELGNLVAINHSMLVSSFGVTNWGGMSFATPVSYIDRLINTYEKRKKK